MVPRFVLACVVVGLAALPVAAQPPKPKHEQLEKLLSVLHQQRVSFDRIHETSVFELLHRLSEKYEIEFVIQDEAFKAAGVPDIREQRARVSVTKISGMTLHRFLSLVLHSLSATYLVRGDYVEIVPISAAAKETDDLATEDHGEAATVKLREPLVSALYKEKPLNEALADLADEYDLTVVVAPQAGDARMGFVTARLLNQPADKAVELLALQADLRVVRRGTAYLVTSKDHADGLLGEQVEREKQKAELQRLKDGPPDPPPAPEPKKVEPEPKKP